MLPLDTPEVYCPTCGSSHIFPHKQAWRIAVGMTQGGPIVYTCLSCNKEFQSFEGVKSPDQALVNRAKEMYEWRHTLSKPTYGTAVPDNSQAKTIISIILSVLIVLSITTCHYSNNHIASAQKNINQYTSQRVRTRSIRLLIE